MPWFMFKSFLFAGEEGVSVPIGFRRVSGQAINDGSLPKQKSPAANDSTSKEAMVSCLDCVYVTLVFWCFSFFA